MAKERILFIAHGHPDLSKGGGEVAAYNLYKEFDKNPDYEALFLAALPYGSLDKGTPFSTRRKGEILFATQMHDFFRFEQPLKRTIWYDFKIMLEQFKPTIVHFHHYVHLGIEMIREVKNYNPDVKIFFTLHEYLAICHQAGQMVKRNTHAYCYEFKPHDCNKCFPEFSAQDFFLRKSYIMSFFELVDHFISPSKFLIERYEKWGLPKEKMTFIENGHLKYDLTPYKSSESLVEKRNRVAFFGQINPFKGVDILLKAVELLPPKTRKNLSVNIYGSGLEFQDEKFRLSIKDLLKKVSDCVKFHGPYESSEITSLMMQNDWVVVPSIWWENSPMVIQEAFCHGRPVICSDIGGMKEKIRDGVDGIHFKARSVEGLSEVFENIAENKYDWNRLSKNIIHPLTVLEVAKLHEKEFAKR